MRLHCGNDVGSLYFSKGFHRKSQSTMAGEQTKAATQAQWSRVGKHRKASFTPSNGGFIIIEINPMRSSSNADTTVISKIRCICEKMRCECLEAVSTVKCTGKAPSARLLTTTCSRSVFLICLFSLCFSLMRDTWKTSLGCPNPRHSEISLWLCYFVFISFAQVFHVAATLLDQLSKPEAKTLPRWNQLPALTPPYLCLSHSVRVSSHFSVSSICGSVWQSEPSMPMWLSSPQGTVQVSRLGWRIQAQSVTNAFGWSASPRGTLFHSSAGTWQQSPQELLKGEKLYQPQPMLLHAHPSPLNHKFKTRCLCLSFCRSLCLILLFMCFPSFSWVGQLRALGE